MAGTLTNGRCVVASLLILASPLFSSPAPAKDLVELGRKIFFGETFGGNGRTCGTCHRAERNFTIDPVFIAGLPKNDPLFVAEFVPALKENFEKPELMRTYGLIVENTNGFDDLENNFTMRGVPHLLGLSTSVESAQGPRTGWSGDGAPDTCPPMVMEHAPERCPEFDGSLRAFALGAVIQHFPRTLARRPGVDFRLPDAKELDALEAFQLSLGRKEELELPVALRSDVALLGQEIFLDDTLGKCDRCHFNAGANTGFAPLGNINFNTGVEDQVDQPAHLTDQSVPGDDGFGSPGDRTFNPPPLVEAADTGPFFHNNSIHTLEAAVAFYNDDAFNNSPAGAFIGGISLTATQVAAVAAFLRAINAVANIDASLELIGGGKREDRQRSVHEIADAIRVLREGGLHADAILILEDAERAAEKGARRRRLSRKLAAEIVDYLEAARARIVGP